MNSIIITLLLSHLLPLVCSLNFTNCFSSCLRCPVNDFSKCQPSSDPCLPGYFFQTDAQLCVKLPSFYVNKKHTNIVLTFFFLNQQTASELTATSASPAPTGWTYNGTGNIPSSVCSTLQGQTISTLGQFSNNRVTKTFNITKSTSTVVLSLYFVRLGWKTGDKVTVSIQNSGVVLGSVDITASSFTEDPTKSQRYLSTCGTFKDDSIVAAQFTLEATSFSQLTSIDIVFEPSVDVASSWAISNIRVLSGCTNFGFGSLCKSCLSGFYFSNLTMRCESCSSNCQTCINTATNCLSCPAYSASANGTCMYSNSFVVVEDPRNDSLSMRYTTVCNGIQMLGGAVDFGKLGSVLTRSFTLSKHVYLKITFKLVRVGSWGAGATFKAEADNTTYINKNTFLEPLISPFCNTSELSIISDEESAFNPHTASSVTLRFTTTGTSPNNTTYYFAVKNIVLILYKCPLQCSSCLLSSKLEEECLVCNQFLTANSKCVVCPYGFYLERTNQTAGCKACHATCKNCHGQLSSECDECYDGFLLSDGYRQPDQTNSISLYSLELDRSNFVWQNFECTPDCADFMCSNYRLFGNSKTDAPTSIKRKYSLPKHTGYLLMVEVFKLGDWESISSNYSDRNTPMTIQLLRDGTTLVNITVNKSVGSNICSPKSKDFYYSLYKTEQGHVLENVTFQIRASGPIAIRQFILFLQNCDKCLSERLDYDIQYMPIYTKDNSKTGINSYLKFNKPLLDINSVLNGFVVDVAGRRIEPSEKQYLYDLRLFTPVTQAFINSNISFRAKDADSILSTADSSMIKRMLKQNTEGSSRLLEARLLASVGSSLDSRTTNTSIARYDILETEQLEPIQQIHNLMFGFTNSVLYCMLFFLGLGLGIVLEEFSLTLQLVFMHIYINSNQLPATFKLPLQGIQIIEHLNYFTANDRKNIEAGILPQGLHQQSEHVFEQYNVDINFIRAIYPIVIINLIYLAYFIILSLLNRYWTTFGRSENAFARWFREIVQRPLNFWDYFFRWQFVTVIWSCILQFQNLNTVSNPVFKGFNTFFTILFFVLAVLYPIFLVIYLYYMKLIVLKETFNYLYEDIFFKRIKKSQDQIDSFNYILLRFLRYFIYALFVGVFINHQVVTPVVLIIITLLELLFIWLKEIYMDKFLFTFKIVESLFMVLLSLLSLVSYGVSAQWSSQRYLQLGYVADAFVIIIILNAFLRSLYLIYLKISEFMERKYRISNPGQSRREINRYPSASVLPGGPVSARALAVPSDDPLNS